MIIDTVYEDQVMEVKLKDGRRGQPWFTKEIAELRKAWHRKRRNGWRCGDTETKKEKGRVYVKDDV